MAPPPQTNAEMRLAEKRAARDVARADVLARFERLRADVTPARIGARVKADVTYKAREAAMQAIEIAGDNRGIMAGAATAIGLWLARKQAMAGLLNAWGKVSEVRALFRGHCGGPAEAPPGEEPRH